MTTDPKEPLGSPAGEALKAMVATAAGAIPLTGAIVSASLWGALQAQTTAKLNAELRRLQDAIDASGRSAEELLRDPIFRAGVALLFRSITNQEADSKLGRIHSFLLHRLRRPASDSVVLEAVLRAFTTLPASHIESLLQLLGNEEQLRDFVAVRGPDAINIGAVIDREFADADDQDHCGSAADVRGHELKILCGSLESAGLVKLKAGEGGLFETTALAKDFVWYCLPPLPETKGAA